MQQETECHILLDVFHRRCVRIILGIIIIGHWARSHYQLEMRSVERYLPHSHVSNERAVPVIMAGCIAHARNGRISTSGLKSDVTIVFLDPDFL